ncbi:hypothetical protein E5678_14290 [Hydrogenophaga sp. PAMC20947]|nr:hypothetical protein E5678_14290 [Hydrogenophaga sp. PAMC20947]
MASCHCVVVTGRVNRHVAWKYPHPASRVPRPCDSGAGGILAWCDARALRIASGLPKLHGAV